MHTGYQSYNRSTHDRTIMGSGCCSANINARKKNGFVKNRDRSNEIGQNRACHKIYASNRQKEQNVTTKTKKQCRKTWSCTTRISGFLFQIYWNCWIEFHIWNEISIVIISNPHNPQMHVNARYSSVVLNLLVNNGVDEHLKQRKKCDQTVMRTTQLETSRSPCRSIDRSMRYSTRRKAHIQSILVTHGGT